MRRVFTALVLLILASLACSLSGDDNSPATAVPIRTSTLARTPSPTANTTSTPGRTLQATPEQFRPTSVAPPTVINCTPRTDWPLYTVKAGDTLGVIAQNTGSTITDLTRANCLANPDSIAVGQQLRVPRAPATATTSGSTTGSTTSGSTTSGNTTGSTTSGSTTSGNTTGSTTGSTTSGQGSNLPRLNQNLAAAPVITLSATEVITLQPTISLSVGVVENADQVRFLTADSPQLTGAILIGTDIDPFDGAAVEYTFNEFDSVLYFYAEATNESGAVRTPHLKVTYNPNYNPNPGGENDIVRATPYIGFDGNLYTLQFNAVVTLSWAGAPATATRVEFYYTPTDTTTSILIGTDTTVADGAAVTWVVPENALGTLSATAIQGSGIIKNSLTSSVYSESD